MFLVEGNKLVDELLSSNFKVEKILVTDLWLEKFPEMASRLPFYDIISQKQMEQISCMVTAPGILATAHTPYYNISPADAENEFIIALDGINDPGNLGTIIRTADWFGIKKIVCSRDCADASSQDNTIDNGFDLQNRDNGNRFKRIHLSISASQHLSDSNLRRLDGRRKYLH